MSALKSVIERSGGLIDVSLQDENTSSEGFMPFVVQIRLHIDQDRCKD